MLSKYIHDLLYRYECVIIPDFGGILTKNVSARIDEETNTFHPPTKRLSYNSQLTENDGLLANHIATVDKVPYKTAINFIKFEVSEWINRLKTQDLFLDEIGVFTLNSEGNIVFEPDVNSNFATDSFGLEPIKVVAISRDSIKNKEVIFDSISDLVTEGKIPIVAEEEKERKVYPFFKYAATVAFLLAFGYVGLMLVNNRVLSNQVAALEGDEETQINKRIQEATFKINTKLPDVTVKVFHEDVDNSITSNENDLKTESSVASKHLETKEETISPTDTTSDKPISSVVNPDSEDSLNTRTANTTTKTFDQIRYHIVGGAFRVPRNAEKKVRQLQAKGYDAYKMELNKWQLTPVAYDNYSNIKEALVALRKIRREESKEAWIYKK